MSGVAIHAQIAASLSQTIKNKPAGAENLGAMASGSGTV
jgi:hypothetical protein